MLTLVYIVAGFLAVAISTLAFTGPGVFEDILDLGAGLSMVLVADKFYATINVLSGGFWISFYLWLIKVILLVFTLLGAFIAIEALIPDYVGKIKSFFQNIVKRIMGLPGNFKKKQNPQEK